MTTNLTNKAEILFIYDVKDANPNGDPLDENKPRIDEETEINIVTDVRLKRTIRDYLFDYKGFNGSSKKDIFVREIKDENGYIQDGKARARDFNGNKEEILEKCIDVRLFGGTIPKENDSITFTGPVQFKMGRSLHPVVVKHLKGTGAFASGADKKQATFREEDIVYYSLIAFHGIINPAAAKHTGATVDDIKLLIEGMWQGTKNLISRSKFGQMPRLLLKVNYNNPYYFIGDLDKYVKIKSEVPEEKIRDISEFKLDATALGQVFAQNRDRIISVDYLIDDRTRLLYEDKETSMNEISEGVTFNRIAFE
jgi:CRISPR-associated protein Csh2